MKLEDLADIMDSDEGRTGVEKYRQGPDAALHIHWDGSILPETIYELSLKRGKPLLLPDKDFEGTPLTYDSESERLIDSVDKLRNTQMNLKSYDLIQVFALAGQFMQTREDLIATAVSHCEYLKSQNIVYAESRFAPQYHVFAGLSLDQVIGYSLEGFTRGMEETGVVVKPIICIGREAEPELGEAVVRAALNYEEELAGVDLACVENGNPPEKHYPGVSLTFDTSLKITVHAGEMCDEFENIQNVDTAIELLRADGLGHARDLPKYMAQFVKVLDRGIRIESNPISNLQFFIDDMSKLRLDELVRGGVKVSINPDDPAMWQYGDLAHSLYAMEVMYGVDLVAKVRQNAFDTAWSLPDDMRKKYCGNGGFHLAKSL